ncbi:MAG: CoA transferase, partial [Microvirga sp.]
MPLSNHRVLELGDLPAGSYAARLLADFGAEVIKIEIPAGEPARRHHPVVAADDGEAHGVWFSYLNFNKTSLAFDPADPEQRSALLDLARSADVVISSLSPGQSAALGLNLDALRRERPGLVVTQLSWFGPDGPYADFQGSDSICHALAGAARLVGPREGPPLTCPDYQSVYFAGLYAAIATLASLSARLRDGHGRSHAVSVHEATIALSEYQVADAWEAGKSQVRDGISRFAPTFPAGVYACRQGLLGVTLITPAQWAAFCTLIGRDDLARHPVYSTRLGRYASADILHPILIERLRTRTADDWFADSMKLRLPIVVVPSMTEVLETQVFRDHRRIVPITDAGGTRLEAPGPPLNLTATPPRFGGVVPRPERRDLRWQGQGQGQG